jgi:hypothetical protein
MLHAWLRALQLAILSIAIVVITAADSTYSRLCNAF